MRKKNGPARWGISGLLAVLAVAALAPLLYMITTSFRTLQEFASDPLALPATLNPENYIGLSSRFDVVQLIGNTAAYAGVALVICMTIAIPASYALAKLRFRGATLLFVGIVATMGVPMISILVPDYLLFVQLGFEDSPVGVIGMWVARALPSTIFLIASVLRALPDELIEAATLDGAGYFRRMRSIVIPLGLPGIVTASIFNITGWWNDLLVPLVFLQSDDKQTLNAGVATIGQRMVTSDVPQTVTGLLVSSTVPIILYVILQGNIRKGLVMGSVK